MQEVRSSPDSPAARQQRHSFPLLAPRDPRTDSTDDRATLATPARPPRLSHRSRAGCWTCRGRKGKHTNVTTAGNAVWDPSVRAGLSPSSQSHQYDDLPAFNVLKNDEERERKAEIHSPGTFGVVVTPDSFADLPEYASTASPTSSRHNSIYHRHGSAGSPQSSTARSSVSEGSTTIVLQHFEDVSSSVHGSHSSPATPRRSSFTDYPQTLSISASLPSIRTKEMAENISEISASDNRFVKHFRGYIVPRLVQPAVFGENRELTNFSCSTQDVFEKEAARFRPVRQTDELET
nr:hypothetical protein CFP56_04357 [Quercus suber]